MKTAVRLAAALTLGGLVVLAFAGWLRPQGLFDLVAALSLCR
jgi:hypothetical protein